MDDKSNHITLKDFAKDIVLYGDQRNALNRVSDFLSNDTHVFVLKGYAGTGKTYIVEILAKYCKAINRDILLMAPTGKAAKLLASKTGIKASTIHGRIYNFGREVNSKTQELEKKFTFTLSKQVSESSLVIVDEASMISNKADSEIQGIGVGGILSDLLEFLNHGGLFKKMNKVIYIGDSAQLLPVGDNVSNALSEIYFENKAGLTVDSFELEKVIRQKEESGILINATELRKRISSKNYSPFVFDVEQPDVELIKENEIKERYQKSIEDYGDGVIIVRNNKLTKKRNFEVKKAINKGDTAIAIGDLLIITKNSPQINKDFFNGTIVKVVEMLPKAIKHDSLRIKNGRAGYKDVSISYRKLKVKIVSSVDSVPVECLIIEDHLYSNRGSLSKDLDKALYADFKRRNPNLKVKTQEYSKAFREDDYLNALQVKYAYALTDYKTQGSEWECAIVQIAENDLVNPDEEKLRGIYTAITRARKQLYICVTKGGVGIERKPRKERKPREPIRRLIKGTHEIIKDVDDSTNAEIKEKELAPLAHPDLGDTEELFTKHKLTHEKEFKKLKFIEVMLVLRKRDMDVLKIHHDKYEERYIIESDEGDFDINFAFNSKDIFTKTYTNSRKAIAQEICDLFK